MSRMADATTMAARRRWRVRAQAGRRDIEQRCPACGKPVAIDEHAIRSGDAVYHARCALYQPTSNNPRRS